MTTERKQVSFLIESWDLRARTRGAPRAVNVLHTMATATLRRPCVPALPKAHPQALSSAGRELWGSLIMRVRSPHDAGTPGSAGNGPWPPETFLFHLHSHQHHASKTSYSFPDLSLRGRAPPDTGAEDQGRSSSVWIHEARLSWAGSVHPPPCASRLDPQCLQHNPEITLGLMFSR